MPKRSLLTYVLENYLKVSGAGVAYELGLGNLTKLPKMSKL